MPADTKSQYYTKWKKQWEMIRDILEGEETIKTKGQAYLPILSGQTPKEYEAYVNRGSFFNATARTIQGLTGAVIRKETKIEADTKIIDILEDVTINNDSIHEVIRSTVEEIMSYGYYGYLVDMPEGEQVEPIPYLACYTCFDIINLQTRKMGGEDILIMIALMEKVQKQSPDDPFTIINEDIIRVLLIDEDGVYKQRKYKKVESDTKKEEWIQDGEDIIPSLRGKPLNRIPFVFINAIDNDPIPVKPPMIDLVHLNIKHWQVNCDYYHGLHYCAIPTPWAAGFKVGDELYIGAQKAWISDDPQAKCGFLEFTGAGLTAIEKAIDKLENQMAVMGARLLEDQKKAAEAAETVKLRSSGDTATLSTIVGSVERAVETVIKIIADWVSSTGTVRVVMNREYVSATLEPQKITALLQAVQAGQMSQDTFLYNLQSAEILPPDRSIDDEKALIKIEEPKITTSFDQSFNQ